MAGDRLARWSIIVALASIAAELAACRRPLRRGSVATRLAVAALAGLLITGCYSDDLSSTNTPESIIGVETFTGASHCGWDSVEFIRLPSDIIPPRHPGDGWVDFARDTEGVLADRMLFERYDAGATLPSGATDTGLDTEYGALWLTPDANDAVYLVQPDGSVEKWPATNAGCD